MPTLDEHKLDELRLEELEPQRFSLANRFFKENGHKGKVRSNERVFVLRKNSNILAALRACPKNSGYLLRSVWVSIDHRQQGLGTELMSGSLQRLTPAICWCYPFAHLDHFYKRLGLMELHPKEVPDDIASPFLSYIRKGEKLLLMGSNG